MVADLSRFQGDVITLASTVATIVESGCCVYFRTFTKNYLDDSEALPFAISVRPHGMPEPEWEGMNRAFPLRQGLASDFWRKAELAILRAIHQQASRLRT